MVDEEDKTSEEKLGEIELTNLQNFQQNINDIQTRLENIEWDLKIGGEDQIFFAATLTFITIFISFNLLNFFESTNSASAFSSAYSIEAVSLPALVTAIFLRYWATLVDDSKTNLLFSKYFYNSSKLRYFSLQALLLSLEFSVVIILINLYNVYKNFLITNLMLLLSLLAVIVFEKIENGALSLYKGKGFIPKDSEPLTQIIFSVAILVIPIVFVSLLLSFSRLSSINFFLDFLLFHRQILFPVNFNLLLFLWSIVLAYSYRRVLDKFVRVLKQGKDKKKILSFDFIQIIG